MNTKTLVRRWEQYQTPPSFVLGFHGCDAAVGGAVLRGDTPHLKPSTNDYDWLGTGIYFWEGNPQRAFDFAQQRARGALNSQGDIQNPFVVGAIINLGFCLDLRDAASLAEVKASYDGLLLATVDRAETLPRNVGKGLRLRKLDCAVINFLHSEREREGWAAYNTVRADFWEGEDLYPGAGFREQDHIQICVRNTSSIVGYFRPIEQ